MHRVPKSKKQKKQKQAKKREKQRQREQENDNSSNKAKNEGRHQRKKNKKNRYNDEKDQKFKDELKHLGYFIREISGDGNCLFRAVCEQIENNEINYNFYREKCIEYMKDNPDKFTPFIEDDESYEKYLERMSKDGEWGGNLEIYAMSMAFQYNFYIYIFEHPIYIVNNWEKPKKNIILTYHDGKHYNSLRKLEEKNKNDEEKEKKKQKEKEEKKDGEESDNNSDSESNESEDDNINDLISKVDHLNI